MDQLSEMQKAIFKRGTDVGKLAQQLFPSGFDASPNSQFEYDKAVKLTRKLLNDKQKIIYEASFNFNDVLAVADIVVNEKSGLKIFEVKSSTSISETYIRDAALQYWVISNCGYKIKDFSIIYINNQYVRKGKLDIKELFVTESVLKLILPLQKWVEENVNQFKKVLAKKLFQKLILVSIVMILTLADFMNIAENTFLKIQSLIFRESILLKNMIFIEVVLLNCRI